MADEEVQHGKGFGNTPGPGFCKFNEFLLRISIHDSVRKVIDLHIFSEIS